ncbi:amidohydrolase [Aspergillus fijiensis CBS 313.89]|uniref:Amidohydrolase n=1 Tax=Aspergillus fijiensis CBS 313.89 TaxID=1448319 RepID=A0A8G1RDQ9_9EURO|nr:amidohydrolase [Aspergillus fijiensis CBS 313.89]RAK70903.1 amidohydrolase [Aspergillus fijiensis CBS 313.89]
MVRRLTGSAALASAYTMRPTAISMNVHRRSPEAEAGAGAIDQPRVTIVNANLLIPGDGNPLEDAALVISDKIIAFVGRRADIPKRYLRGPHTSHKVVALMPGLWDCHMHFGGEDQYFNDYTAFLATHPASSGARLARGCWEALQSGYTSYRDMAGYGCEVARAIEDDSIVGPNVYGAGAAISQTAGHGDIFGLPAGEVLGNFGAQSPRPGHWGAGPVCIVDGVEEARRAVRLQLRRGAKVIKVMASGGVMSRDDNPKCAQFSPEELKVMVEEAARQDRIVSAHVHGKAGILAAIHAGCKSLEHVSEADEEVFELMKEKRVLYVATRTVTEVALANHGEGLPKESWRKLRALADSHLKAYQGAVKAGVTIALGTDTAPGGPTALELQLAVEKAGMTPLQAIKAATANAPLSVGPQAPLTGQLKEGYEADVIALEENPLDDIRTLQDNQVITHVWKAGRLFKGPGVGPWGETPNPFR